MDPLDRDLLNRISVTARDLRTGRLVRLSHTLDQDQFTEDLRDLGLDLADLGEDVLSRVAELDAMDGP
ncbi:hypothetical protein [Amycolatopsis sp. CA-230715]|uniref:hypothetical protein n=1 Tax=Amycolatopsis sp. CA-230715 TaxID=2745196 RepID=UPI001C012C9A|nr:hypothetical protein [Amycolatopsis sp. CA-230715]QWF77597.1 hypothetical protein HUW46_00989 [Amycolatopsis sp. CA-230715]